MNCDDNLLGIDIGKTPINANNILLQKFDLFIWDFDDTLIDTHAYYTRSMKPADIRRRTDEELNQDIPGVKYFRAFCNFLVCKGKRVGIASFGTYEIIQAYMDRIFGFNQKVYTRNNIKTIMRDCWGNPVEMLKNKNKFINELMTLYQLRDVNRVMLLDDRIENCADASLIGVVAIKIQGRDENSIQGVSRLFDESTIIRIINELTNMLNSGCDKVNKMKILKYAAAACNKSDNKIPNIFPIVEGFSGIPDSFESENLLEELKHSKILTMVIIMLLLFFIILGFLLWKRL